MKYVPKLAKGLELGEGGQEIEAFFANEEIEEKRFSPRTIRTRGEFHANEEIEEMLGHMFPSWPESQVSPRTSTTRAEFDAKLDVRAEFAKNSTQI